MDSSKENRIIFSYKPDIKYGFLLSFMFSVPLAFFVYRGYNNEEKLGEGTLFELSVAYTSLFYYVMAMVSAVIVVVGLVYIFLSLFSNRKIVVTATSISVPQFAVTSKVVVLNINEIKSVRKHIKKGGEVISVKTGQMTYHIQRHVLASKNEYEELYDVIRQKIGQEE